MERELTRAGFAAWLESLGHCPAGVSGDGDDCPLARFLGAGVRVDYFAAIPAGGTGALPLPRWARQFTRRVDAGPDGQEIPGAEALRLLQGEAAGDLPERYQVVATAERGA